MMLLQKINQVFFKFLACFEVYSMQIKNLTKKKPKN